MRGSSLLLIPVFGGWFLLAGAGAHSQTAANPTEASDANLHEHIDGLTVVPVADSPFSAKVTAEITSQLPDGTNVERRFYNLIARDHSGHVRLERRHIVAASSNQDSKLGASIFLDPIANTRTVCEVAEHTCHIYPYHPAMHFPEEPVGLSRNGESYMTRENLGPATLDDVDVQHTRETQTYNPGTFGNIEPLSIVKEFWYSSQLQINLKVTRYDPRSGLETLTATNLKMSEPDPALFVVPEDYTKVDEGHAGSAVRVAH